MDSHLGLQGPNISTKQKKKFKNYVQLSWHPQHISCMKQIIQERKIVVSLKHLEPLLSEEIDVHAVSIN